MDVSLQGCRPEPLGSYLKALGLFRLISEQADPSATASWHDDRFTIRSALDPEALVAFLLDRYAPSPIVSPWNGGSGFGPKDQQAGIATIEASQTPRLTGYRHAIGIARGLVADSRWAALEKEEQVRWCRAELPDMAVRWIDAAVVLTTDSREFPPLLGTGGNVGRLEFSNNFMQRVVDAFGLGGSRNARKDTDDWLRASLQGGEASSLVKAAVGQFDPGGTGGANSDPVDAAGISLVNPWDFVLAFEGALLFASGAARRMGSTGAGKAAMPFMVNPTPVGYASAADAEGAKGELWTPLWSRPATLGEIARLLGEGRAEWASSPRSGGAAQARTGLDFARSVAALGVDRGIDEFVRHSFLERHGQNMLAVPIGRFRVREPSSRIVLTHELDRWLGQVRRVPNRPNGVDVNLRILEQALMDLAEVDTTGNLQAVLIAAGRLDRSIGDSTQMRSAWVEPLVIRNTSAWLGELGLGSSSAGRGDQGELRLAVAFASQRDSVRLEGLPAGSGALCPAEILRPIAPIRGSDPVRYEWQLTGRPLPRLGRAALVDVLADVVAVRSRRPATDHVRRRADGRGTETMSPAQLGAGPAFRWRIPAPLGSIGAFLAGTVDDDVLADVIEGCLLFDFSKVRAKDFPAVTSPRPTRYVTPAYTLLAPFYAGRPLRLRTDRPLATLLSPAADWASRTRSERQIQGVIADAIHRLRVAQVVPLVADPSVLAFGAAPERLAASLAFPIDDIDAGALLGHVAAFRSDLQSTSSMGDPDRPVGFLVPEQAGPGTSYSKGDSDE